MLLKDPSKVSEVIKYIYSLHFSHGLVFTSLCQLTQQQRPILWEQDIQFWSSKQWLVGSVTQKAAGTGWAMRPDFSWVPAQWGPQGLCWPNWSSKVRSVYKAPGLVPLQCQAAIIQLLHQHWWLEPITKWSCLAFFPPWPLLFWVLSFYIAFYAPESVSYLVIWSLLSYCWL